VGACRVTVRPGVPPSFALAPSRPPWPGGAEGRELLAVAVLDEASAEWRGGLRVGMVLTAVATEYVIGPYHRSPAALMSKIEGRFEALAVRRSLRPRAPQRLRGRREGAASHSLPCPPLTHSSSAAAAAAAARPPASLAREACSARAGRGRAAQECGARVAVD
jgi:hypothetical protein